MYRQQIMDNQINHLDRLNNYQSNQTPSNTGSQICCLIDEGNLYIILYKLKFKKKST